MRSRPWLRAMAAPGQEGEAFWTLIKADQRTGDQKEEGSSAAARAHCTILVCRERPHKWQGSGKERERQHFLGGPESLHHGAKIEASTRPC